MKICFLYYNFSFDRVQTDSGAQPTSHPTGTGGSHTKDKAAGARSRPPTYVQCRGYECMVSSTPTTCPHGAARNPAKDKASWRDNQSSTGTTLALPFPYSST